jgi:hypothetical protein
VAVLAFQTRTKSFTFFAIRISHFEFNLTFLADVVKFAGFLRGAPGHERGDNSKCAKKE